MLSSNLSSSCNRQVCLSIHGNQAATRHFSKKLDVIFLSAHGILASRAVDHAKVKTTKYYSQGILFDYLKICTNENFSLYD